MAILISWKKFASLDWFNLGECSKMPQNVHLSHHPLIYPHVIKWPICHWTYSFLCYFRLNLSELKFGSNRVLGIHHIRKTAKNRSDPQYFFSWRQPKFCVVIWWPQAFPMKLKCGFWWWKFSWIYFWNFECLAHKVHFHVIYTYVCIGGMESTFR